jgi:hypothetical protein
MSETTPDLELLKKWAALKAEEEKKRHTRKIWLNGFVFGVLACSIVSAGIVYGLVMPNVQAARISTEQAIFTATTQRQACEARFEKATVLWDSAAAPPRQIPLFNGLLNVTPGAALGGEQSAVPSWFVPADVPVIFYGDPGKAQVVTIDRQGIVLSRTAPLTLAQVRANPDLLKIKN